MPSARNDRTLNQPSSAASSTAILVNVVSVGLGGLYLSTQSITVTVIGAALVAVLALPAMLGGRRPR